MVVNPEIEHARALDQLARQPDVLAARRRITARMIVQQDDRRGGFEDRRLEDLAGMDQARLQGPFGHDTVPQETVVRIEQRDPEDLVLQILHERSERRVHFRRAGQDRARARDSSA